MALASGSATCSTTALTAGQHALTAAYGGDSRNAGSTSNLVNQVINTVSTNGQLNFSPATCSVTEGQTTNCTLTVTRTGGSTGAVTVGWSTANGTAVAGTDFGSAGSTAQKSGSLSWTAGDAAAKSITVGLSTANVPVLNNAKVDGSRSFTINLGTPTGSAVLGLAASATVTIVDATGLGLATSAISVNEDAGSVVLSVNRTGNAAGVVTAHWAATNGTASAGTDYGTAGSTVLPGGTLSWAAGDAAAKTITIPVLAIGTVGVSRTFTVSLSAATGGATLIAPTTATVTIVDTSNVIQFSAATASVNESAGTLSLSLTRSGNLANAASVVWATSDGTAVAGTDFGTAGQHAPLGGTVTWAAGDGTTRTLTLPIINTGTLTGAKVFSVALSSPSNTTLGAIGLTSVTIQENDLNAYFTPTTYAVTDRVNPSVTLTVNRAGAVTAALSVTWAAVNGTARAGTDYGTAGSTMLPTGTLSWAANSATAKTISIPILPVTNTTGGRAFQVVLSSVQAGVWLDPVTKLATVTINDDATATVAFDPAVPKRVVTEAPGATATLNVLRNGSLGAAGTVNYTTVAGSAVAGTDYTARSNVAVPFAAGQSTATIAIPIVNHTSAVPPRAFQVVLSAPSVGLGLGTPTQATVQILGTAEAFPAHGQWPSGWVIPQVNGAAGYGWQVSNDPGAAEGYYCLKSDSIFDGEAAQVQVPDASYLAGNVTFKYRVSSEPGFDFLRFYMDGSKLGEWSGAANATTWGSASFTVPAGHHTFTWTYEKDASVSVGNDTAWIDAVTLPAVGP